MSHGQDTIRPRQVLQLGEIFADRKSEWSTMKRKRTYGKNPRLKPKDNGEAQGIELPEEQNEMYLDSEDDFEGFADDNDGREDFSDPEGEDPNDSRVGRVEFNSTAVKRHEKRANHTKDELVELERNLSSFQSSFFKLQVDQLLAEVRVKYDKMQKVEKVLHQLKDIIMSIPTTQEQLVQSPPNPPDVSCTHSKLR